MMIDVLKMVAQVSISPILAAGLIVLYVMATIGEGCAFLIRYMQNKKIIREE